MCPGQSVHFRAEGEKIRAVVATTTAAAAFAILPSCAATGGRLAAAGRGGGSDGTPREVERLGHDGGHGDPRRGTVRAKALPEALKVRNWAKGHNEMVWR